MRRDENSGELPGQDSFLDIVANIVGILILLVMVVGLRAAQQGPVEEAAEPTANAAPDQAHGEGIPPKAEASFEQDSGPQFGVAGGLDAGTREQEITEEQLQSAVRQALAVRNETLAKARKIAGAREEIALRDAERLQLAVMVAEVEGQIEEHRQSLGEQQRRRFEVRSSLGASQHELDKLMQERVGLVAAAPENEVQELENLPTPLATTVSGDELQIRLAGGHVKIIPWEALGDAAKREAEQNLWRLDSRDEMRLTVGPIDGFRMEFEVLKRTYRTPRGTIAQIGSGAQVLQPESEVLGEPVDRALRPDSQLMTEIARLSQPRKPTITVWTYEDSFEDFRRLKAELFEAGYSVAGRPLPEGAPIGRSPRGTKSAAQ